MSEILNPEPGKSPITENIGHIVTFLSFFVLLSLKLLRVFDVTSGYDFSWWIVFMPVLIPMCLGLIALGIYIYKSETGKYNENDEDNF